LLDLGCGDACYLANALQGTTISHGDWKAARRFVAVRRALPKEESPQLDLLETTEAVDFSFRACNWSPKTTSLDNATLARIKKRLLLVSKLSIV
jgi:hypothetical protein